MRRPLVHLLELAHIVNVLDDLGTPAVATKALRAADLNRDMLLTGTGYLPYAPVAVTLEAAARALGERHLGVHVGRRFDYGTYSGYAEYVLSAPYLGAALVRARRALPLIHPGSDVTLRVDGRTAAIGFDAGIESVLGYRHIREGTLFVIAQAFHHFLGPAWHPLRLEIPGEDDRARSLLEEFMQSPLRIGARQPELVFDTADLRAPNPQPEHLRSFTTLHEVRARMSPPVPGTTADAVRHLLRSLRTGAEFSQESAARFLAIGPRTLQRDLRTENTSFRDLKEHHLAERSRALLTESHLSIDGIARTLGYTEPNSFRRAFQRWAGVPPSEYRRREAQRS